VSPTVLPSARRPRHGLQGHHVLAAFLVFFAAVFIANGAMIYSAISTHTGLVANEPYRKGLHYNERIAAEERQARLGWVETIEVTRDGHVSLKLAGDDGRPVGSLKVIGALGRPSTNRQDIQLALTELAPGRYEARLAPLGEGNWIIALDAFAGSGQAEPVYRTRRRLWLKP
jgi:nitrogen fixation protein FixH